MSEEEKDLFQGILNSIDSFQKEIDVGVFKPAYASDERTDEEHIASLKRIISGYKNKYTVCHEFMRRFKSGEVKIDIGKHQSFHLESDRGVAYFLESIVRDSISFMRDEKEPLNYFFNGEEKTPVDPKFKGLGVYLGHVSYSCNSCGREDFYGLYKDDTISLYENDLEDGAKTIWNCNAKKSVCNFSEGFPEYSIEIDIPSGKMVLYNDLRQWFEPFEKEPYKKNRYKREYSASSLIGQQNSSKVYEEDKSVYLQIGNCACIMYQTDDSKEKFMVGDYGAFDDIDAEDTTDWPSNYKQVGNVCTDLWAYCVADLDEFEKRAGEDELIHKKDNNYTMDSRDCADVYVVECKPGRYKFTHRYHLIDDYKPCQVYTNIERIDTSDE
jgi:hypothetical protein